MYTCVMDGVYSSLFDRIIGGDFEPGDHLKEQAIADELGVSRTPVREAVRELVEDGLVDLLPKRGARVVGFTVDDVEEIYNIRLSLELLALKYAEHRVSLQRLKEIRADILVAAASDDPPPNPAAIGIFFSIAISRPPLRANLSKSNDAALTTRLFPSVARSLAFFIDSRIPGALLF